MAKHEEFIHGICQQMLFSPNGGIEGALVKMKGTVLQVSVSPEHGDALWKATGPGRQLHVLAVPDRSPKAEDGPHPVFKFTSFTDVTGLPIKDAAAANDQVTMKGVVSSWHFSRHGEPNGVILENGEFIHVRPHGMAAAGLDIGTKVTAIGALRMTVLGTRMLEAHSVNHVALT